MPIFLDPARATFDYVLRDDRKGPEDQRPTFTFRQLPAREQLRVAEAHDALQGDVSVSTSFGEIIRVIELALVGWRNMNDIEFAEGRLIDIINMGEAAELVRGLLEGMRPSEDEAKKSESQPATDTD